VIPQVLGTKLDIGLVENGNKMTNSDIIEEILFNSHSLNIANDVIELGIQLRINNPKLDKATAYQIAFSKLTSNLN